MEAVTAHAVFSIAYMDDAIIHIEAATYHMMYLITHMQATTAYTATTTTHDAPGTIEPPFEPTTTANEKMEKSFLNQLLIFFRKLGKLCSEI